MNLSDVVITGAESLTLSGQAMGKASMYLPATSVSASSGHGRNQSMVHLYHGSCKFLSIRRSVSQYRRRLRAFSASSHSQEVFLTTISHLRHGSMPRAGAVGEGRHPLMRPGNCWARRPKLAPTGLKHRMTCRRSRTRPRKKLYRLSGVSGTPARHSKLQVYFGRWRSIIVILGVFSTC